MQRQPLVYIRILHLRERILSGLFIAGRVSDDVDDVLSEAYYDVSDSLRFAIDDQTREVSPIEDNVKLV